MRPVREITAKEEHLRMEPMFPNCDRFEVLKRDPVKPEPEGTIVLMAFRITGYDQDCDGSLMARLEQIDSKGEPTGWEPTHLGLYPSSELVVTAEEWAEMFRAPPKAGKSLDKDRHGR